MAGSVVTFTRPGYSSLFTKDLPYTEGSGESDLNPLDPSSVRPLMEGEWLELSSAGTHFTRGGNNDASDANEGTNMAFMFFMEKGRYDSQISKKCHTVWGPSGFEFRTKGCKSAGVSVGTRLTVQDVADEDSIVRRWLGASDGGAVIGVCTRVYGTDDIGVYYCPALV